ncbi:MAG: SEC-C metal-binding domain-containing protein [Pseudonocardiales bacterium]
MSTKSIEEFCALAQELEQDAARYPDERGEILLEAADKWERAGQFDQAVAVLRGVLTLGGEDAGFARYSLADLYFNQGADAEAWEHLRALEEMGPTSTGPAALAGELLEARGEYEAALHWFDRAMETVDVEALPKPGAGPSIAAIPLFGRQRCRAKLGLPVDELDRLADIAEDNRREFVDLLDRFAANRPAAPARASAVAQAPAQAAGVEMLVWTRAEQQLAMQRWPEVFTAEVAGNHADIEQRLRELSQEHKPTRISLVLGSVDGFADYLNNTGGDPAEESVRLAYAEQAREQGRVISWPPGRNQLCWCGSERKYKKCCGAPATAR